MQGCVPPLQQIGARGLLEALLVARLLVRLTVPRLSLRVEPGLSGLTAIAVIPPRIEVRD